MKVNPVLFKSNLLSKVSYKGGKTLQDVDGSEKVYKLSSNENPIGPSPMALEAVKNNLDSIHIYPDRTDVRFREKLSQYYGGVLGPDHFITSNSGVALLEMISRAFLQEGNEVIISNPAFSPYEMFARKQGATVIDVPLMEPSFSLDVTGILNAITTETRLLYITSPNNPTGTHIPKEDIDTIINNIPDHVLLIYDEVYFHFCDAPDFTLAIPYVENNQNIIAVNSFAKSYGLAGLRMGYGYGKPELMNYMRNIQRPFFINSLGMHAAMAALDDKEHIQSTVHTVHTQKQRIYETLDTLHVPYWKTQSNFILIKPPVSPDRFEEDMFAQKVMVRPVGNFGAPECIRITIGNQEATDALIKALQTVIPGY